MMRVGHHYMHPGDAFIFETGYGPIEISGTRNYITRTKPARLELVAYVRREMALEELIDFACGIVRSDN